ncbi:MAG: putative lipid II flippase FtsW [Oscillospiraceae bacterium]|nr:putative lipid II flippase FtsW [Oscillospiraceae bacterium]
MDQPYLILTVMLVVIGLLVLFSASYARAYYLTGNSASYFINQLLFAVVGVIAMLLISRVPYDWYRRWSLVIYGVTILLLLAVLIPGIGVKVNGARRWINLGITNFQPSEIAKFAMILMLSIVMCNYQKEIRSFRTLLVCGVVIGLIAILLILEPHFSATIIIGTVALCMMLIGGVNWKYLLALVAVAGGLLLLLMLTGGYTSDRITAWRNPEADPLDTGLQILQSEYAIGSGGLLGLGFGKSRQKYLYLPEEHNDYIFAIACEELGFIGAVGILLLFALLIIRGYWIAVHARDRFSMLLAAGLTTLLAVQVILNVAVVTNLLPATGISLPFFSSGGTALMMQLGECGIVLNISRSISQSKR